MMLSQTRLKEVVEYSKVTGTFTSKVNRNLYKIGDVYSKLNASGYIRIKIDYVYYYAHRLAWLYEHGCWPKNDLDHINGVRSDNRWENLREATRTENLRNKSATRKSVTGVKGVDFCKVMRKYRARIRVEGKRIALGYFGTIEAATLAYAEAAKKLHGDFAEHLSRG